MRWRFVDCILEIEPWTRIVGQKAVSFEEYSLLKRFGRKGVFPECLVLECCVELTRWLVAASSGFAKGSVLAEVEDFHFEREAGMGSLLDIAVTVEHRQGNDLSAQCRVTSGGERIAGGQICAALLPMDENFDPELVKGLWRELHGAT